MPDVKTGNIFDSISNHRAEVIAREVKVVNRLAKQYNVAAKSIYDKLKRVIRKIEQAQSSGVEVSMAWLYQEARLKGLLLEIDGRMSALGKDSLPVILAAKEEMMNLGIAHGSSLGNQIVGNFAGLNHHAVEDMIGAINADDSPLKALLSSIGPTTVRKVTEVFTRAVTQGWNPRKTAQRAAHALEGESKHRISLIARTEQLRAYRTSQASLYEANSDVVMAWRWTAARTRRTCPMCAAMDGQLFPPGTPLSSHPACFPSGVTVASNATLGVMRRAYKGLLINVTLADGTNLSGTPNHPVLTSKGWKPLEGLNAGDQVMKSRFGNDFASPNDDNRPTLIEEVFNSFANSRGMTTTTMPITTEDFHGDGTDGEVQIIFPDGFLRNGSEPISAQEVKDDLLITGQNLTNYFDALGPLQEVFGLSSLPQVCPVCSCSVQDIFFGGSGLHHLPVSFEDTPLNDSSVAQPGQDSGPAHPEPLSKGENRFPRQMPLTDISRDFYPATVTASSSIIFDGFVHNIETKEGWYLANGIIVHNCRCSMVPVPYSELSGGPELETAEEWFGKLEPDQQDTVIGKTKGEMYRNGEFKLKDNVVVVEDPNWGTQYRPRRIEELRRMSNAGTLPSQSGNDNLSRFRPAAHKSAAEDPIRRAKVEAHARLDQAVRSKPNIAAEPLRTPKIILDVDRHVKLSPDDQIKATTIVADTLRSLPTHKISRIILSDTDALTAEGSNYALKVNAQSLIDDGYKALTLSDVLPESIMQADDVGERLAFKFARVSFEQAHEDRILANVAKSLGPDALPGSSKLYQSVLEEFGKKNYQLGSAKMFRSLADAVSEAFIAYKKGEYQLGMLPEKIEKPLLKEFANQMGHVRPKVKKSVNEADRILGLKIGEQAGSNPGGFYLGTDGIKRYVKFYAQADRAEIEQLGNLIYKALDVKTANTVVFQHSGRTAFASDIIEGAKTIGNSLSTQSAQKFFDGFFADVLLANWDVAGMGLDNVLIYGGEAFRIDAGASLFFRAQGGLKPIEPLTSNIHEVGSFFGSKSTVAKIAEKAGYSNASDFAKDGLAQIDRVQKWANKIGISDYSNMLEWVKKAVPTLSEDSSIKAAHILVNRVRLLGEYRTQLAESLKPVKKVSSKALEAHMNAPAPKWLRVMGNKTYEQAIEPWTKFLQSVVDEGQAALSSYKTSGYQYLNKAARNQEYHPKVNLLDNIFQKSPVALERDISVKRFLTGGGSGSDWVNLTKSDVGTIISDRAYQSTSVRKSFSWHGDVEIEIHARKGERGLIPPGLLTKQAYIEEHELILRRNALMLVKDVTGGIRLSNGRMGTKIVVELLPEDFKLPKGKLVKFAERLKLAIYGTDNV